MKKRTSLDLSKPGARKIVALCMSWALKSVDDPKMKKFIEEKLDMLTSGPFYDIFDSDIKLFLNNRKI